MVALSWQVSLLLQLGWVCWDLHCLQQLLNPILSSNCLQRKSSEDVEVMWEARSRPGCEGPQRKCTGYLSTTSCKMKLTGDQREDVKEVNGIVEDRKQSDTQLTWNVRWVAHLLSVAADHCQLWTIFLRVLVHLDTDFFSSINFELRITRYGIVHETIMNLFKISLDASLCQNMENMVMCLFSSLPKSVTMKYLLLNDLILSWEKIECPWKDASGGFTFFQEMSKSAIDNSLIPTKKAFWALRFWNCFA